MYSHSLLYVGYAGQFYPKQILSQEAWYIFARFNVHFTAIQLICLLKLIFFWDILKWLRHDNSLVDLYRFFAFLVLITSIGSVSVVKYENSFSSSSPASLFICLRECRQVSNVSRYPLSKVTIDMETIIISRNQSSDYRMLPTREGIFLQFHVAIGTEKSFFLFIYSLPTPEADFHLFY